MNPSNSESGVLSKPSAQRPACDRCRGQKLRCIWDAKEPQCQRCQRADAVCTIPLPRPMGRPPRQYRGHSRSQSRGHGQNQSVDNPYAWSVDNSSTAVSSHEDTIMMMSSPNDFSADPPDFANFFADASCLDGLIGFPPIPNPGVNLAGNVPFSPANDPAVSSLLNNCEKDPVTSPLEKADDNHVILLTHLAELSVELFQHPLNRDKRKTMSLPDENNPPPSTHTPMSDDAPAKADLHLADLGVGKLLEMTSRLAGIITGIVTVGSKAAPPKVETYDRSTALMALSCYTRLEVLYSRSIELLGQVRSGSLKIKDIHLLMPGLTIDGFQIGRCDEFKLGILVNICERAHERIHTCVRNSGNLSTVV
ncbi:hypothetical protein F4778DRAFT_508250 [Xylariomycetidae sp. FL2044]|nr:hypothetical protein F4778DRAFT_508250 [Xylariomycetidae sp. FL2044]